MFEGIIIHHEIVKLLSQSAHSLILLDQYFAEKVVVGLGATGHDVLHASIVHVCWYYIV